MGERIKKVNELIRRELSQIILKEVDFSPNVLVTIIRVECSVDLRQAKAFISVLPEQESEKAFETLNKEIYHLQKKLNKRLEMKIVPKIIFKEEKEVKEAAKIEELLEKIKKD